MGITVTGLEAIVGIVGERVLSLGYPDLIAAASDVENILGVVPIKFVDTGRWHGLDHPVPETAHVFELLGATLDCVDIHASRGIERIVDLNYPQDLGEYDLVLDCGTVEHCFNIGQAILNAANAVKVGGYIFHMPPLSMVNHGFYNLNPTLFHDFYTQNGWEIEILCAADHERTWEISAVQRIQVLPELSLHCLARRRSAGPLKFPTQTKYLLNPELK